MMIGDGNDEGSGVSSGSLDGGNATIGGGSKGRAAEEEFGDDSGMRTTGARASDLLEGLRCLRIPLFLLLDRTGDLDLLLECRRR